MGPRRFSRRPTAKWLLICGLLLTVIPALVFLSMTAPDSAVASLHELFFGTPRVAFACAAQILAAAALHLYESRAELILDSINRKQ